jgi:adenine-specific DNA-methyltransferase
MTNYEKLINTLKEVFMLDKAELDFGIYRIMNQKRKDIEQFLEVDLVPQVQKVLAESLSVDKQAIQKELDDTVKAALTLGADPNSLPKVQQLKVRLDEAADLVGLENEVFSLLANFFRRYFDNGDFISMRRYKKDVYSIPYEGEEVKLHWANADQYYIKTSEYFKNYRFKINNGKSVVFELIEASTEQNNNKTQGDKERRFALYTENPCEVVSDEFKIYFTYEPADKKVKQSDLLAEVFDTVKTKIPNDFLDLLSSRPTEKEKQRTLLQKHLLDYTARNTFDYFIHKDLGGFLTRELDFYIKNEVLFIDDLNTRDEQEFLKQLSKIKAIKKIGEKIITFLAQLENFQKKLWLKKKMVVECNYCITLDRVPEELYPEIATNHAQINEWVRLFAIDEIKEDKSGGLFPSNKKAFTNPLTIDFLKQNPFLLLDTAFFDDTFKWKLISAIENFDEQCDGLLINSENFQALNFLLEKYENRVDYCYIDPPYNTDSAPILYKNDYKDSSWLSLMNDRLIMGKRLLSKFAAKTIAIDDTEMVEMCQLTNQIFSDYRNTKITVIHNPKGSITKDFNRVHEYAIFYTPSEKNGIIERNLIPNETPRKLRRWGENSLRTERKLSFYPIFIKDKKIVEIGDVQNDNFHPTSKNTNSGDLIAIWPIDQDGVERRWNFGLDSIKENLDRITVIEQDGVFDLFVTHEMSVPKTVWSGGDYDAGNYGNTLLINILGKKLFDFPKSIKLVEQCLNVTIKNKKTSTILDYFSGSGTTGHAVINLNRDDVDGRRKYILVEMGNYFETVTKPRIQKVIYSKDWKDGKPVNREGISQCFKYIRLEGYEDTLNNLELKRSETQQQVLELNSIFREGYMLNYMLDVETQGSLLNLEWFENPFDCRLNITRNNEMQPTKVDLVETFNYLIGLVVEQYAVPKEGYVVVTGKNLSGEKILVVWRDCTKHNSTSLNEFLSKSKYNPLDNEFDRIYVNGDNNVENLKIGDERWKVVLIEEEFKTRMFENY